MSTTRRCWSSPSIGLVANLVAFALLRAGSKESLNVEGAYLEVLSDTVGSVAVIAGAVVIATTGWSWVDPVVAIAIGVWILPRAWRLAGRALRIVMQSAPPGLDLDAVAVELSAIDGVVDVHDLHVWTLTSDMEVASAHLASPTAATRTGCSTRRVSCCSLATASATPRCRSSR